MNKDNVISLRKAGATYQEISDSIGISKQRVHQIIKKYEPDLLKIDTVKTSISKVIEEQKKLEKAKKVAAYNAKRNEIIKLAKAGKTQDEIARKFGIAQNTVSKICIEAGLRRLKKSDEPRKSHQDVLSLAKAAGLLKEEGRTWKEIGKLLKANPLTLCQNYARMKRKGEEVPGDVRIVRSAQGAGKVHKKVQELKEQGFSYSEIAEKTKVSKSALHYYYYKPYFERH